MNPEDELNYYEVGGSVRDRKMGREPQDRDYVIVGHSIEEVEEAGFERVVGERFPVFLHPETGDEYAMARTEEKVSKGHKGFEFHASPDVTLEEDLARRDFTINAMARDPETGEIIDPYHGEEDIEAGVLRHTTDAFTEDPLRILRGARFASRFRFDIADETVFLCRRISDRLEHITEERIAGELKKAMKQAERPSVFFETLEMMDALNVAFPEVYSLRTVPAGPSQYHREGSAFGHTMMVLDSIEPGLRTRMAALAHDFGKPRTPTDKLPKHHGHDREGADVAERFANRLKLSNELRGVMVDAAEQHMRFKRLPDMSSKKVLDLVEKLDRGPTHISPEELIALSVADEIGRIPGGARDYSDHTRLVRVARGVIDNIGGQEILDERPGRDPGEWVGDAVTQARVEAFDELRSSPRPSDGLIRSMCETTVEALA